MQNNYFERSFAGKGITSVIYWLRKLANGFNPDTQQSDGGGVEGVNSRLDTVANKLDTLNISVKIDDPDIAATKTNTDTIVSDLNTVKTDVATIKSDTTTTTTDVATVKADVATIKSDTASIKTNTVNTKNSVDTVNTNVTAIYTLLNDRLLNRVVLTRAEYDVLVNGGTIDPDTLYYVIESQSNS